MTTYSLDTDTLSASLKGTSLQTIAPALIEAVQAQGHALKHGHLPRWEAAVALLPPSSAACRFDIVDGAIAIELANNKDQQTLHEALQGLMPWRKGPFQFGTVFIDTEWRSDWKWDRLVPHISSLQEKTVLDVGCGSGYHLWRMRRAGAAMVLGIDPSLLYLKQFEAAQHFIQDPHVQLLPLPMEALPADMHVFDTIFSMGVLYHRRDFHQHLLELRQALKPDGELILETLVVPGDSNQSLLISGRYANMRNIYELPDIARLQQWMEQAGFHTLKVADVTPTSRREQRTTDWMTSHSLAQALDPADPDKTIEGHPRPLRATMVARC